MLADAIDRCLAAQDTADLEYGLGELIDALPPGELPLQSCCTQGGIVDETERTISLLSVQHTDESIQARIGVFFTEVVGGCNCHDDPVRHHAYCVVQIRINRRDANIEIALGDS